MTTMTDVLLAGVFLFTLVGLPSLAIAASTMFRRWLAFKEKALAVTAASANERSEYQARTIQELQVRVQVLERIVTDRSQQLAAEIEDLRNPQPAN